MEIPKAVLELRHFAWQGQANDPRTERITGVLIDGDAGEAYATNGALAVAVPLGKTEPGLKVLLSRYDLERIPSDASNPLTLTPVKEGEETIAALLQFDVGRVAYSVTIPAMKDADKFPAVRHPDVMPQLAGDGRYVLTLNAEFFRQLMAFAVKTNLFGAHGEGHPEVQVSFNPAVPGNEIGAKVRFAWRSWQGEDSSVIQAVVCPMRVPTGELK